MSTPEWTAVLEKKGYRVLVLNDRMALEEAWRNLTQEVPTPIPVLADPVSRHYLGDLTFPQADWIKDSHSRQRLSEAPVGVTGVSQLASRTGTVMLAENLGYARWVSNIPPRHIALVPLNRVVPDWAQALSNLRQECPQALPRVISWISGPSQTADIAGRLVRGMHGPRHIDAWILTFDVPEFPLILDPPGASPP